MFVPNLASIVRFGAVEPGSPFFSPLPCYFPLDETPQSTTTDMLCPVLSLGKCDLPRRGH
jgi:hypothetical protein